jgi:hypothetical protein
MADSNPLHAAIETRVREYNTAIDRLRELASDESESEVYELTALLREAVELARCLRRLTQGRTTAELHNAFGAPGDFGYGTPIGSALDRVYREAV